MIKRLIMMLAAWSCSPGLVAAEQHTTAMPDGERNTLEFVGEAYDYHNPQQLLYREYHALQLNDNGSPAHRQVDYYSPQGELIASKINHYGHHKTLNPTTHIPASQPGFMLEDYRNHYSESAEHSRDGVRLTLKENGSQAQTLLNNSDYPLVIDAGFDEFIRHHWPELTQGDTLSFSFASAARQTSINFDIRARNPSADEPLLLIMTPRSTLLSWLLDPIQLEYQRNNRQLIRYRGLSNLPDSDGDGQQVDIRYRYFHKDSASVNTDQPQ